jgi:hypothetical protein
MVKTEFNPPTGSFMSRCEFLGDAYQPSLIGQSIAQ